MILVLVVVGCAWTAAFGVAALLVRRPGPVLGRAEARRAWQELHGLQKSLQDTSRLVGLYVGVTQWLARPLARAGVAPNLLTLASLGPAVVAAGLIGLRSGGAIAGGALVLLTGLLDGVDGAVAALSKKATELGFVLDSATDRLVDLAFVTGPMLADRRPLTTGTAVAAGAATMWMEYVRARSQIRRREVGRVTPAERPTRVVLIGLGGIGAGTLDLLGFSIRSWFWPAGLIALAAGCVVSALILLSDSARTA